MIRCQLNGSQNNSLQIRTQHFLKKMKYLFVNLVVGHIQSNFKKMSKTMPSLYSQASNGKQKEWTISVKECPDKTATITIVYGYTNGKKQTNMRQILTGKNMGRLNQTTPYQQACNDAESKWNKKRDDGYQPLELYEKQTHLLPMLALNYSKRGHDIHFPCSIQPKVDGIRCIYYDGKFFSRKGKEFTTLGHIATDLTNIDLALDGELYSYSLTFQELSGLVRKLKPTDDDQSKLQQVKYIVFDQIKKDESFDNRFSELSDLFKTCTFYSTELLHTLNCERSEQVSVYLAQFESLGYEGMILRNCKSVYESNQRSKHLQKLKTFQDSEYLIVGYSEGSGLEKGCVIWKCETPSKLRFSVRPIGTREKREELFINGDQYIGQYLTVKFQELTTDGIPRFPVGQSIRNYE